MIVKMLKWFNIFIYCRLQSHPLMKIALPIVIAILFSNLVNAQFETNYTPVQNKNQLPNDLVTLSSQKYQSEKANLKHDKGRAKKAKNQFLLESSFEIDALLLSGKVVFNDPMSDYVNKVADKVLAKDPETRKKLRFYILKSTYVNASATNQGIIFINMGLLAQLENEAQLAYVISHEVIHYKNKHSINHAVEADKIDRGSGSYKTFSKDEKLLANRSFSKELETEADVEGFEIFKKTQYSTANVLGLYDVLKYSYLPFDDIPFDKAILENPNYRIPNSFIIKETQPIDTKDEDENPKSTHPSIKARRKLITEKIANVDNTGKSDFLVSKEQFDKMRTTARFELSRLYLLHHQYEEGLYNSYMLLRKYPDNLYLKKNVLECLENLASYANSSGDFDKAHNDYKDIEGKMQAVNYLFEKMDSADSKDITVLAMAYAAKLKKEYPKDQDIDAHAKYLVKLLVKEGADLDYFSGTAPPPPSAADSIAAANDTTSKAPAKAESSKKQDNNASGIVIMDSKDETSKYTKIKNQEAEKKEEVKAGKGYYAQYALVDYYKEPWLEKEFKDAEANKDKEEKKEEIIFGKRSTVSSKVYSLGLEKVTVVNPYYARLNANKKNKFKYLESEGGQIDFVKRLKQNGRRSKLEVEILDSRSLSSSDADKLNDIALLEEYVSDRVNSDADAPYPEREKMQALAKKYNTDYFLWTGVISYKDYTPRKTVTAVMSGLFPFILPMTLSYLINGGHYTYYFNMMYDVKNDQVKMGNFREAESRTGRAILNSHIYDTFNQIHSKPKAVKEKDKDSENDKKQAKK